MQSIPLIIQGQLNLVPELTSKAQNTAILLELQSSSLISLKQLCNDSYTIQLIKRDMKVYKNSKLLLKETRNVKDSLWDILVKTTIQKNNIIYPLLKGSLYIHQVSMSDPMS